MAELGVCDGECSFFFISTLSRQADDGDEVPLSFFTVPTLSSIKLLTVEETNELLSQYQNSSQVNKTLLCRDAKLFRFQKQKELNKKAKQHEARAVYYGDISACEIYLVLQNQNRNGLPSLSVWGRRRRPSLKHSRSRSSISGDTNCSTDVSPTALSACRGEPSSNSSVLFYLSASLEDYFRLGASFGWIYGWQQCYDRTEGNLPLGSLPWLKAYNHSAVVAH
ncbi:hypothetical protein AGDE_16287 [Angomonas deanei]|uniref:Uncharacterized protein n=1 Tax=Angomonas deanei TaxID=59799 RepID=A0A7G2C1Y2_9TRYP|nr:hypothetical protein AGDE_16287 [Angomonas deanei]CAD2213788.1 hypothetical protein, conserved [Angomonas deanei]|eukprot:EPY17370.1 hypothetical protein AGDE_16287 [Angomonas deanei]